MSTLEPLLEFSTETLELKMRELMGHLQLSPGKAAEAL